VTEPHGTLERIVLTLTARWAVVAVAAMFVVIWVGHAVVRALAGAALAAGLRARVQIQRLASPPAS